MRTKRMFGVLVLGMAVSWSLPAQNPTDELTQLKERVAKLEKQIQDISKLVEPLKEQQSVDNRRKALRTKFEEKLAQDRSKYTTEQLREAESLYQVANQKWGSPEALESLQTMMKKYPDINRTGCAALYVAQKSKGEERAKYLRDCIEKFNDCYYGDGVQVGAFARFLLAGDFMSQGDEEKAVELYKELKEHYPDAVDHSGRMLMEGIKVGTK